MALRASLKKRSIFHTRRQNVKTATSAAIKLIRTEKAATDYASSLVRSMLAEISGNFIINTFLSVIAPADSMGSVFSIPFFTEKYKGLAAFFCGPAKNFFRRPRQNSLRTSGIFLPNRQSGKLTANSIAALAVLGRRPV